MKKTSGIAISLICLILSVFASCATSDLPSAAAPAPGIESSVPRVRDAAPTGIADAAVPADPADTAAPVAPETTADPADRAAPAVDVTPAVLSPIDPDTAAKTALAPYASLTAPREIALRLFPRDTRVQVLSGLVLETLAPTRGEKDTDWYRTDAGAVWLNAPGYDPMVLPLPAKSERAEAKLEHPSKAIRKLSELPTGYQPKSVRFSPDGRFIFVAHLGDYTAVSQYGVRPFRWIRDLNVPEVYRGDSGFVETLILEDRDELWVTQMTRNTVHIFDLSSGRYLDAVEVSGDWPKVLLANDEETRVYVSCWTSNAVVEIDTATRKELRSLSTSGIPRGLAFNSAETELLAANFSSAVVDRIDLATGELTDRYDVAPGREYAMRHIVHDRRRKEYYVTAMGVGRVYRLSEDGEWRGYWTVGDKPNTCAMSPDGRWLFVSCRGPNNPDVGYLHKGYEFGKVFIINLDAGEVSDWIWGRDQTTGLDVSPDGRYLAFSDFLSHSLELYAIAE